MVNLLLIDKTSSEVLKLIRLRTLGKAQNLFYYRKKRDSFRDLSI